ncbi:MAG: insulinase family protein [Candidatus Saganbacteria bacterium]|nr:insulinase family protein [Candidatus Saganbacteria bacterium]
MNVIPSAKKTELNNGLTLVTEDISSVKAVAMGVMIGAGSANETKRQGGLSHLIEHMTFKGTPKRSAYEIAKELDAVGGKMNAYTTKEYTVYYAIVLDKHIDTAVDVLSDIVLNPSLDPPALEMEKGVILEEIKMYQDTPDELVHDLFAQQILREHPIGRPTIGNADSVKGFTRDDLLDYRKDWYTPDNTIISLAGDIPKKSRQMIEQAFGRWQGKSRKPGSIKASIKGGLFLKKKKTEQVHLCLGVRGVAQTDEERYPYAVLDNILGGNMSSRLFQEVREKRGLVYSIFSTSTPFRDLGLSYVYAGTSKKNLEQVIELILAQFGQIKNHGVSPEELNRAKENMKGTLVLGLESTAARMNWLAKSEFYYGRTMTIDEIFTKVDKVTNDHVIELAERFFRDEYLNLTVIGDLADLPVKELHC